MSPSGAEWLAVAAPLLGTIANFASQVVLARFGRFRSLLMALVAAAAIGAAAVMMLIGAYWFAARPALLDGAGIAISALIAYGGAALMLFALVNLGETSLRIQMIERLMASRDGLSAPDLLAALPETNLIGDRIRRMTVQNQVRLTNGRLYPKLSLLSAAAFCVGLLKRLLYGPRG